MYKTTILKNGIRVITHKVKSVKSSAVGVWVSTGGRFESLQKAGISHFMEHMLFKGTKSRSATKVKEDIEGIGGLLNGFTDEEATCYLTKVVSKHLNKSLDVLSDMAQNALFLEEDIEKERSVILEEIRMYEDIPMHHVHELICELLWPGQPLGMPLSGTKDTVKGITKSDLLALRDSYYTGRNIAVACAGDVDHADFVKQVETKFKKINSGEKSRFKKAIVSQQKPQVKFQNKDTQQTHIALGLHGLERNHPDRYAFSLLNIVLGANMSSRLFKELREKRGLVYEVSSYLRLLSDTGAFLVNAGLEHKKLPVVIELILKELKTARKELVRKDELDRAKEYYAGNLLLSMEDTLDYMIWLGQKLITDDKIYTPDEILKKVRKVNLDDLKRVANDYFKDSNLNLALVGPIKDQDKSKLESLLSI